MDPLNTTDTRISRTFQTTSPLLNLILAASILSKLAQGKSQAPWFPYRPIIGYYPQPLLYPIDPLVFRPAQSTPLNQQQIIHIHDTPGYNPDGETYEDNTNKYTQNINNFPPAQEEEEEEFIEGSENIKLNDSLLVDLIMNQNISENHFLTTTTEDPQEEQYQDELETAGTNVNRRRQRPSEYSEYIDEYQEAPKPKRRTTPARRRQPSRVNSRIGQYRTTTPEPEYYEDYDYSTVKLIRKNPLLRVPSKRRTTTTSYEEEDYLVQLPNRMKTTRINRINRRTTKPAYYDDDADEYDQDYAMLDRPQDRTFRQSATTTTTAMTTTTTTDSSTTTMQPNTTTTASPNNTNNAYGPPANNHPGYGPSNGNENISITYGPPAASQFWDSWYNQYSKSSVIRRIQELLTPSNYYSPQQETDDYYNGVF